MRGKIAVEEHFVTPELKETIFSSIGWDPAEWQGVADQLQDTGTARLADMDAAGIEMAVLSLAAPCIQDEFDPVQAAVRAAAANDALAEIVAAHPSRYAALAALPLQDPMAAAEELERCVRDLGFKGALANGYSSVGDLCTAAYYDEPQYLPFWERVAALDVPFYLHPRNPLPTQRRIYDSREVLLGPTWAFTVETATHCLRLMVSGLFDRLPSLNIIIGHMGELLPFAVQRTEQRLSHIPAAQLERSPQTCLRENFYLTTSGNFHTPSLIGAMLQVGADRLLFAADHPFEQTADAADWFDAAPISEADRLKIGATNAQRLLGLSSSSEPRQARTPEQISKQVLASFDGTTEDRLREIMQSLTRHLHAFVTDVGLTEAEWGAAIEALTATGHITNEQRQEFILWSDTLGVSMLVDALAHPSTSGATESTVLGPFYVSGSPLRALGANIAEQEAGTPAWVHGRVLGLDGAPIAGAELDIWQNGSNRLYAVQDEDAPDNHLRGKFVTANDGRFAFQAVRPVPYPIPYDGPVGRMLAATGRHPWRPAHIHIVVRAAGFATVTTHIFDAASEYLDRDAVFAVKPSLVRTFAPRAADDPDRPAGVDRSWVSLELDLVLAPGDAGLTPVVDRGRTH